MATPILPLFTGDFAQWADDLVNALVYEFTNMVQGNITISKATNIEPGTIETDDLEDAIITDVKVATSAITNTKLAPISIDTSKLQDGAVGTQQIKDAAITNALIGNLAVSTAQIMDLAVNEAKLNALAVTEAKIAALAVSTAKIQDLAVAEGKIANLAVTTGKINDLAVTSAKIANATITAAQIALATITYAQIAAATITNAQIAAATITNAQIALATIVNANINDMSADKITAGTISAQAIQLLSYGGTSVKIYSGKTSFTDTAAGFILGVDGGDSLPKFSIGDATKYLNWTGTKLLVTNNAIKRFENDSFGKIVPFDSGWSTCPGDYLWHQINVVDANLYNNLQFTLSLACELWWGGPGSGATLQLRVYVWDNEHSVGYESNYLEVTQYTQYASGTLSVTIPVSNSISVVLEVHSTGQFVDYGAKQNSTIAWGYSDSSY
jgi:hypothetical protein